jgi:hypothetical protein
MKYTSPSLLLYDGHGPLAASVSVALAERLFSLMLARSIL